MPTSNLSENAETLGGLIRLLREERKLTLRELAKRCELSAPFLSDVEHNRRSTDKLDPIAQVLDVPVAELQRLDKRMPQELKEWMSANPSLSAYLDDYRRSGQPVDRLLQALQANIQRRQK